MNIYEDLKKGLEQAVEREKRFQEIYSEYRDDVGKYKKKRNSNVSKSRAKASHKHNKKECLLINKERPYYASYCSICGKIHNWSVPTVKDDIGYRMLESEEIFEKYKGLTQFYVDDLWNKYISIVKDKEN